MDDVCWFKLWSLRAADEVRQLRKVEFACESLAKVGAWSPEARDWMERFQFNAITIDAFDWGDLFFMALLDPPEAAACLLPNLIAVCKSLDGSFCNYRAELLHSDWIRSDGSVIWQGFLSWLKESRNVTAVLDLATPESGFLFLELLGFLACRSLYLAGPEDSRCIIDARQNVESKQFSVLGEILSK